MNIRQLEAFRALMNSGTVTNAATLMGVSQPSISRLLEQLEYDLRLTLFDRSKGRLVPTAEARILFEETEKIFLSVDRIKETAREIRDAKAGQLQIAVMPALALGFLPGAIQRFKVARPNVSIAMHVHQSYKIDEWAAQQQIDFGIAEYPSLRPGVERDDFCRAPLWLASPPAHPLASKSEISPHDLVGAELIGLGQEAIGRQLADDLFRRAGLSLKPCIETPYYATIAALVQRGLGVGFLDPFTAADFRDRGIVVRPFRPVMEFHVGILHPHHRPLTRVASEFLALLKSCRDELFATLSPEWPGRADLSPHRQTSASWLSCFRD